MQWQQLTYPPLANPDQLPEGVEYLVWEDGLAWRCYVTSPYRVSLALLTKGQAGTFLLRAYDRSPEDLFEQLAHQFFFLHSAAQAAIKLATSSQVSCAVIQEKLCNICTVYTIRMLRIREVAAERLNPHVWELSSEATTLEGDLQQNVNRSFVGLRTQTSSGSRDYAYQLDFDATGKLGTLLRQLLGQSPEAFKDLTEVMQFMLSATAEATFSLLEKGYIRPRLKECTSEVIQEAMSAVVLLNHALGQVEL